MLKESYSFVSATIVEEYLREDSYLRFLEITLIIGIW